MADHQPALKRGLPLLAGLAVLVLASLAFALAVGSVPLGWQRLLGVFTGEADGFAVDLVLDLRLPRALSACATGGMLALAGALMQALLRNPLADPYILGVSGGAAVGALGALMAGLGGYWLSGSAFCGALLSMLLVFALARGPGEWSATRLLLTGVVVAAGWGAAISFILAVSPDSTLRGMMFWLLGDLGQASDPSFPLLVLALGLAFGLYTARDLNVLVHGEHKARSLGVATAGLRLRLYVASSLLTAVAVTVAGNVGFIGLIAPHLLRLVGAHDHRILLPASALLGAAMLTIADTLARTAAAPLQLPVGVITALLGVPLFLYLLRRSA
ncbi:MAG: iron ABC transporter permease [Gammaproteobacteria bacterium]|jgi:iron complex transport system permease protein|nr:iron ABC transporter permease [Gammaproteobacteria bacterium]